MFDRLKQAFSSITSAVREKQLSGQDLDSAVFDFQISLIESDVAQSVAEALTTEVQKTLEGTRVDRSVDMAEVVGERLNASLEAAFARAGSVDIVSNVREKAKAGEPYVILFLGINGTGKTTTVAKFANFLKKNGLSVVCAAGDTHRPGAIEQLSEHAERLSLKVVSQRYGADPAAVGRDGVLYAKAHHVDCLLIDTAGRMQTNQNLMEEMSKIARVVRPDFRIFVADALTGNDAVSQAALFNQHVGFDGAILTKADADVRGGAALSIVYTTGKPVLFLGVGQGYDDLSPFDAKAFLGSITAR
ncbi:MAG: signal recognition particle-docking protein FtsY [Nitrososphaerota archaeon]|nr:signal recognition particle-docking protein FtsY [Nitrososphaerota archaeon]MDG6957138.1 signal recognition particle-docking protein FtsY [Nitrososphaerota archaeon]MDG6959980.1 signal recognition particle-docking protein FtsY [Nitrososphaerota archaeon]MDG6965106.1 signal recognition particle-docking protein FtsY [Nitrososphaerota archaeon]MDG6971723.1 signal recognition particle-docking protein FtsY [Nitrososphaerota archaeon]